jgi:hypothetical protein
MRIVQGVGEGIIAHARNAARALVCLFVPWSAQARLSRAVFERVAELLDGVRPPLGAACFLIEEDNSATRHWLESLQPPWPVGAPWGSGPLLWLEHGQLRNAQVRSYDLPPWQIVARCRELWGAAQE